MELQVTAVVAAHRADLGGFQRELQALESTGRRQDARHGRRGHGIILEWRKKAKALAVGFFFVFFGFQIPSGIVFFS